jgi:hypothetical protein
MAWSASLAFLAAVGLGISVGSAAGGAQMALRTAGALLAALALLVLARQPRRPALPSTLALAGLIVAAIGLASGQADAPLYFGCYVALLAAGSNVVPAVCDSLVLASLPGSPGELGRAPTIDIVGRRELIRARRSERPLTVGCVAVDDARRPELVRLARRAVATVRETDLVGYAGGNRFFLVFVETPRGRATEAWDRLCGELDEEVASRLRAGFASFPDDNPTWEGLTELASERGRSLASFAPDGQPPALAGTTVPNEA